MITYKLTHPQLSEPMFIDSEGEHTDTFLANNAWHYILRTYDEMIDRRAFTIERVSEPPDEYEFQQGAEAERQSERLREGWGDDDPR